MIIGIVTFHRAHNYGAILQAISLRYKLMMLGHNVNFIDYWPEYHASSYRIFNPNIFRRISVAGKLNYIRRLISYYPKKKKRISLFKKFINEYIAPYSYPVNASTKYDAVIYGSDQIWRKMQELGNKFDPFYFGENGIDTATHLSYAASMGILCSSDEDKRFLTEQLCRFSDVGVRELDLLNLIRDCGIKNTHLSIDPTLLLNKQEWLSILNIDIQDSGKPYILFYDLMTDSFDINVVKRFAQEKGLELKVLKGRVDNIDYGVETIEQAGPREFVSLIANADFVFTSSFHGLAFSLIFEKQFLASYKQNGCRALTLLENLGLKNNMLKPMESVIPLNIDVNYKEVAVKLENFKNESLKSIMRL